MTTEIKYNDHWLRMLDLEEDLLHDGPAFTQYFSSIQQTVYRTIFEKDRMLLERGYGEDLARIHSCVLELNKKILSEDPQRGISTELARLVILTMQLAERIGIDLAAAIVKEAVSLLSLPCRKD